MKITLRDDGTGIDTERVVEKAVATGIVSMDDARRMSDKEKLNLVFLPGFSMARDVTDVSGRGVGMDVVKTNIEKLGGHIEIESELGVGTCIRLRLPLTLAIIPSLIVRAGPERFAIPQVNVRELVGLKAEEVVGRMEKIGGAPVLRLRERLLPLVRLADILGLERTFIHPVTGEEMIDRRAAIADRRQRHGTGTGEPRRVRSGGRRHRRQSDIFVVVLRVGENLFGLIVDELFDMEEIVVKPLSSHIKDCQCFAGATIMGDGRVAMILDAAGIASFAKFRFAEVNAEERRRQIEGACRLEKASEKRSTVIVFNSAPEERFALPLGAVSRLEKIDSKAIERLGSQELITYRGRELPLIRLDTFLPVRPLPENVDKLYVLIPKNLRGPQVGILASAILDTVETETGLQKAMNTHPGFLGSGIVEGTITRFLDAEELLRMFCSSIHGMRKGAEELKAVEHEAVCHI